MAPKQIIQLSTICCYDRETQFSVFIYFENNYKINFTNWTTSLKKTNEIISACALPNITHEKVQEISFMY